jgi:hypothetical protein
MLVFGVKFAQVYSSGSGGGIIPYEDAASRVSTGIFARFLVSPSGCGGKAAISTISEPLFQTQALVVICLVNRNISRFVPTVPWVTPDPKLSY